MCNLYRMRRTASEVGRLFGASMAPGLNLPPEVYPGYPGLGIRLKSSLVLEAMN
jgi:hypothetical protein